MTEKDIEAARRPGMSRTARISECGRYRYSLERLWTSANPLITWIMLNPSTADADKDDPTIRRCMDFSRSWGFAGMVVVNLFAWRATDPADMKRAVHPVGPANDAEIMYFARNSEAIVAAWGTHGAYQERGKRVLAMLDGFRVSALGLTSGGFPLHPLYVPKAAKRILLTEGRPQGVPNPLSSPGELPTVTSKLPTNPQGDL